MLATSRQPLDVPGEHTCVIPPLPVPEPGSRDAGGGDAVELFAQRAAAVVPGFTVTAANRDDVTRLCRRLDGIPLAIELATVRLRAVPLEQLASRLEDRFALLTGSRRAALPHHQTLRDGHRVELRPLLGGRAALWARLSVFAGSFDIPAAEEVCEGGPLARGDIMPTLIGLIDKSVVLAGRGARARGTGCWIPSASSARSGWPPPARRACSAAGISPASRPGPTSSPATPRTMTSCAGSPSCAGSTPISARPSSTPWLPAGRNARRPAWRPACGPTGRSPARSARGGTGWPGSWTGSPARRRSGPGC